jgi:hypothetical protein
VILVTVRAVGVCGKKKIYNCLIWKLFFCDFWIYEVMKNCLYYDFTIDCCYIWW